MKLPETPPFEQQECNLGNSYWNVPGLVQLSQNLPTISVPLDALNIGESQYTVDMRHMVAHLKTIINSDLCHPILLSEDGQIFDGRHRIMLALYRGYTHIDAKRFDTNPQPDRIEP
jgi:hypothetical protein